MKQFAVIGNPIGHSLSPYLHNFVYNSLGIDAVYERKRVLKSELPQIINLIKNGNLSGINVTIPHKENIMEYLDNINPRAQSIGAVNIIMNKEVVEELIQSNCNSKKIANSLNKILATSNANQIKNDYEKLYQILDKGGASKITSNLIFESISK